MQTNAWGATAAVALILAAMIFAKSSRPIDEQTAEVAVIETTGSITQ